MFDLNQTYRRYFPIIRAKCSRILGNGPEAEEVAQETFLRLWRWGPRDQEANVVTSWVYRTATRLAIDRWRRNRVAAELPAMAHAIDPSGEHGLRLAEIARRVPRRQLEAVLLHRVDGLSQTEVAEVLGLTDRSVRRMIAEFDSSVHGGLDE